MIKAALIDLDGFLVNSEQLYLEANKVYFKQFNFDFTEDIHRQGMGKKFDKWITAVVNINKPGEEILQERNAIFFTLVKQKLSLLPGAKELLVLLRSHFSTALVTSSQRDSVDIEFKKTHIRQFFDLVVTGEMVTHGKPDPECYLIAAQRLQVSPQECAVFEDAPNGVLAGKNAGMKVIAVPSRYVKGDEAFQKADLLSDTLSQITLQKVLGD